MTNLHFKCTLRKLCISITIKQRAIKIHIQYFCYPNYHRGQGWDNATISDIKINSDGSDEKSNEKQFEFRTR